MNRSSAAKSVGKIDQLLDELANLATSPDVSTKQFCSRSVQVTESLLDLQWAAVVSYAGDAEGTKAPILVAGHDVAVEQLGKLNQPFPRIASQSSQTSWLETLKRLPHIGFGRYWRNCYRAFENKIAAARSRTNSISKPPRRLQTKCSCEFGSAAFFQTNH